MFYLNFRELLVNQCTLARISVRKPTVPFFFNLLQHFLGFISNLLANTTTTNSFLLYCLYLVSGVLRKTRRFDCTRGFGSATSEATQNWLPTKKVILCVGGDSEVLEGNSMLVQSKQNINFVKQSLLLNQLKTGTDKERPKLANRFKP